LVFVSIRGATTENADLGVWYGWSVSSRSSSQILELTLTAGRHGNASSGSACLPYGLNAAKRFDNLLDLAGGLPKIDDGGRCQAMHHLVSHSPNLLELLHEAGVA